MAITKRPKPTEAAVERVIRKGGSVPRKQGGVKTALVQLRLPRSLVERIDTALKGRTVPPSRHTWLLEAVHEKLHREEGQ